MPRARSWDQLLLVAGHERLLAARSRSTALFAAVFGALALAVAASGYVLTGGIGVQDFARTAVSLVQLVLLLVPLTAISIGVLALTPERGASELVFAQPVARGTILVGRLAGLLVALGGAQLLGFGAAGLVVHAHAGQDGIAGFLVLVAGSFALTAVFLGIAALVAVGNAGRRARALAIALVIWFCAVVLFDVAALALATCLRSGHASRLLVASVLINPVDAVRTVTLLAIEGDAAFGAASLAFFRIAGGRTLARALLAASVLAWIVGPILLAVRRLRHTDL